MTDQMQEQTSPTEPDGWEWMLVEIMGHRSHWGRARQEERFGAKMLRIDVPVKGDPAVHGWKTHYYGGASIFSFTLTDEATVMAENKPYEPPHRLTYSSRPRDGIDEIVFDADNTKGRVTEEDDGIPFEEPSENPDREAAA